MPAPALRNREAKRWCCSFCQAELDENLDTTSQSVRMGSVRRRAVSARHTAETVYWHWPRSTLRHWRPATWSQRVCCSPIGYSTCGTGGGTRSGARPKAAEVRHRGLAATDAVTDDAPLLRVRVGELGLDVVCASVRRRLRRLADGSRGEHEEWSPGSMIVLPRGGKESSPRSMTAMIALRGRPTRGRRRPRWHGRERRRSRQARARWRR